MRAWILAGGALLLDALVGDPPRLPHPTRAMGALAFRVEPVLRRALPRAPLAAGALGWLAVVGAAAAFALAMPALAGIAAAAGAAALGASAEEGALARIAAGALASIWLVYVSIAPRDLASHALRVARALRSGGLEAGRKAVAMIVGRDPERLDEAGVIRAAVESVAESAVDGVAAPLFWAFLLGPAGAFAYRAANTLDSMWGHRDERYLLFGRVAARADDVANWLPARLAFTAAVAAATILGLASPRRFDGRSALELGWRDRRKHESPNAAWLEAAFAGALGIALGGPAWYGGDKIDKPILGEARREPETADIGRAVLLMLATTLLFAAAGAALGG